MTNYLYWALCIWGAMVCIWYELSKYTRLTIFGSIGLLCVAFALWLHAFMRVQPDTINFVLVLGIVLKLTDRIVRKAICEPHGWRWIKLSKDKKELIK